MSINIVYINNQYCIQFDALYVSLFTFERSPMMARYRREILEKTENRRNVRILNYKMISNTTI